MTTQHPGVPAQPTELHLKNEQDLSALSDLADPSQLTTLILRFCDLTDLRPLTGLSHLTTLRLEYCEQVSDLSPLAGLSQLRELRLYGCGRWPSKCSGRATPAYYSPLGSREAGHQ